jgi:DNA-binding NarL/FixJ family response regulator
LRVLLVDDHKIVRDGIRAMLKLTAEFEICGEAESGSEAVQAVRRLNPDIILMDIGLSGLNGIDATIEILRTYPNARIIILSMYDDDNAVLGAIRSGARAFVLKRASEKDLLEAMKAVAEGGSWLSPQVSDKLLARIQRGNVEEPVGTPGLSHLTPREMQVLRLVAEGKSSKEIAGMLNLGLQTVRSYRKTMMKKLNVNNVASLTQLAISNGLTSVGATNGLSAAAKA